MSLINKMLRDLDARHAPAVDRTALPSVLHALPPAPARSMLPLGLVLLTVAGAAWLFFAEHKTPLGLPAASPVTAAAPAVSARPVAPTPPPLVAAETAAATPAAIAANTAGGGTQLKLETSLPKPKEASPAKEKISTKETPRAAGAAESRAMAPKASPALAATTPAKEPAGGQASIDKQPRSAPTEAAENEYRKAMAALRRGAGAEAMAGLHGALRLDSHHVSARQALLSLLVEQQQWSEAQATLEEGLALDPAQVGWAMALARLQLESGKLNEAGDILARHAAHAAQNPEYQAFQALLFQKQKRTREAAERYRAALALRPAESRWWYGLGLVLEADQKPQEAREAFLKAKESGNLPAELTTAVEARLR